MILLDSDTTSLLEAGHPKVTARAVVAEAAGPLRVALITRLERLRGRIDAVLKAATPAAVLVQQHRLANTEGFLARFVVVPFDPTAGGHLERLSTAKPTRTIGRADLLIACTALAHDATLVTRNTKDFRLVPGLKLENWAD